MLWLDAAVGVETSGLASNPKVEAWRDRSGTNNHARQDLETWQPRYQTGAINQGPAVEFNGRGTFLSINDSETLEPRTGDFCVEIVGAWTNSTQPTLENYGYGTFFAKQQTNSPHTGTAIWANEGVDSPRFTFQLDANTWMPSQATPLNDGNFRLYGGRRFGTSSSRPGTLEVRVNSIVSGAQMLPRVIDVHAPRFPALIGSSGSSSTHGVYQALDGSIAEMVFVRGELPDEDLRKLERYLSDKHALRLP